MGYQPELRTPINSRRNGVNRETKSATLRSKLKENVRFSDRMPLKSSPIVTDSDKAKRKRDAIEFIRNETGKNISSNTSTPNKLNRTGSFRPNIDYDPINKRTYELLGENPIRNISDRTKRSLLRDGSVADRVVRESRKLYDTEPLPSVHPRALENSRNKSLMDSLSTFGSKLLGSILYNDREPIDLKSPIKQSKKVYSDDLLNGNDDNRLTSMKREHELNTIINLQQAKLNKLNREIETKKLMTLSDPLYENRTTHQQTEGIDDKLKIILREINNNSNEKLLKEILAIKNEVLSLKRSQESNNIRFESQFEVMRLEQERNKRNFDRMINELEEKREILDRERDRVIKLLKKSNQKRVRIDYSDLTDDYSEDEYQSILKNTKRRKVNNEDLMSRVEKLKKNMSKLTEESEDNVKLARNLTK